MHRAAETEQLEQFSHIDRMPRRAIRPITVNRSNRSKPPDWQPKRSSVGYPLFTTAERQP